MIWREIVFASSKISRQGLFTDDMFSCIRSINGHGVVEIGGDTEIDHVDILSLKDAAVSS